MNLTLVIEHQYLNISISTFSPLRRVNTDDELVVIVTARYLGLLLKFQDHDYDCNDDELNI